MKQFGKILKFELKNYFTNKIFVGVTVLLVLVIVLVMFFPRLSAVLKTEDGDQTATVETMLLTGACAEKAQDAFAGAFPDYQVQVTQEPIEVIQEQIRTGEASCAFQLEEWTSYTYYVDDLSMYDVNTAVAEEVLRGLYQLNALIQSGMTSEAAGQVMNVTIQHETASLGKDQMQNFFYTYIMIFALYMVILLYGQMIATNVATEKSSRAMELLITSAKPTSMMFGKVIASCAAGLTQLVAVFGSALVFYNLNRSYWGNNEIVTAIFDMPVDLFIYMLVFFVLGFFIYAFLYGAVGSTASKLEDINTSVMPITLIFIAGFLVVVFAMTSGNVDTALMKVCSYIPFTSPMAMFTRIAMSTVPVYEIAISIVLLIASAVGVGVLSAKIYRVGVLLYGTPPKIGTILKTMKKA